MKSPHDELVDFITENTDVSPVEAEYAVNQCLLAMGKGGFVGYLTGGGIAYVFMAGAGIIPAAIGVGAIGVGYQFLKSPQCSDVRKAIKFWSQFPQ